MVTDALFHCPLRNVTREYLARSSNSPSTYLYQFNHVLSFNPWGGRTFCYNASCHAAELPFVFNMFSDQSSIKYTPSASEQILGYTMNAAWSNFVINGNPGAGKSISPLVFPSYSSSSDTIAILDVPNYATTSSHLRDSYCDFWDSIGFASMWFV